MRSRGLGRGLGALIPSAPASEPTERTGPTDRGPDGAAVGDGHGGAGRSAAAFLVGVDLNRPVGPAEAIRAVDRWLWRSEDQPLADAPSSGVPRGTPAVSTVGEQLEAAPASSEPAVPSASVEGPELAAGGAVFAELDPALVSANPRQPRQVFDDDAVQELAASISEVGLLQPVVVRPVEGGRYELVMGERRWRAARIAGLERIPAIIRQTGDEDLLRDALLENIQRVQLNPLEEAAAYGQLLEDFGCTQDELATRLGRSRPQVTNTLRLLKLSAPVQRRVAAGVLSAGHAKALLGLRDAADQERLAARVVAEGLSVRSVEELVSLIPERTASRRAARPTAGGGPDWAAPVVERLAERLDTRVRVVGGAGRGRLTIDFGGSEDLARLVDLIDPPSDRT